MEDEKLIEFYLLCLSVLTRLPTLLVSVGFHVSIGTKKAASATVLIRLFRRFK